MEINGTSGNDFIQGTPNTDVINGLGGNDTITGGGSYDYIYGGEGNDLINGEAGRDVLYGGAGNDTLQGGDTDEDDLLYGGSGNDRLEGGDNNDQLYGDDGNDILNGGNGNDNLFSGGQYGVSDNGTNRLNGEAGNDYLSVDSSGGINLVDGGTGIDVLYLNYRDRLLGVTLTISNNNIISAPGTLSAINIEHYSFQGSDYNDSIIGGGSGDNIINGYGGSDGLDGGAGNDLISGGTGDDTLRGGNGNDTLYNNDYPYSGVSGENANNSLNGGAGNDMIYIDSSSGYNIVDGGADVDFLKLEYYYRTVGISLTISSNNNITAAEIITATNIEDYDFYGTDSNDSVVGGGDSDNYLDGRGGNDFLDGGAGNDQLFSGSGSNTLNGGDGNDTLQGYQSYNYTLSDQNTLNGDAGNDVISSISGGNCILRGGVGDDTLNWVDTGLGTAVIDGGAGIDFLYLNYGLNVPVNITVTSDNSISIPGRLTVTNIEGYEFRGSLDNDLLLGGGDSNNRLSGYSGDDRLEGGGGNDTVGGGWGNDTLVGGRGNDVLGGGLDGNYQDQIVFETGSSFQAIDVGRDYIIQFTSGVDKIVLSKTTFTALTSVIGNGLSSASDFAVVNSDALVSGSAAVLVYNTVNGRLFYNANGTAVGLGMGSLFAVLNGNPTLNSNDFILQS